MLLKKENTDCSSVLTRTKEFKDLFYSQFVQNYMKDKGLRPYRTEWVIFSEKYNIAGSIDAIMYCTNNEGDVEYHMFDWKRTAKISRQGFFNKHSCVSGFESLPDCNYSKYQMQLNLYAMILRSEYHLNVKSMNLVVLHPNNKTYNLITVEDVSPLCKKLMESFEKGDAICIYNDDQTCNLHENNLINQAKKKLGEDNMRCDVKALYCIRVNDKFLDGVIIKNIRYRLLPKDSFRL